MKKFVLMCLCLLPAYNAAADTLVTWQADGQIDRSHALNELYTAAPAGTPLSVTLTFSPSAAEQTFGNVPGCMTVPVTASISIGSANYAASGSGFTHAALPGANCLTSGGYTQFSLHDLQQPADSPWSPLWGGVLIFDYRDLLIQDMFPDQPTALNGQASLFYTPAAPGDPASWTFSGGLTFQDIAQPTPVPEPGTVSLLGIGLAALVRKARIRR